MFAAFWGCGLLLVAVAERSNGFDAVASVIALNAAGLTLFYLWVPAASIVVTSRQVTVLNPFRRYVVPRRLIGGIDDRSHSTPRLLVRDAPSIRLAALNLNLPFGYQSQAGRHQRQGVTSMMQEIPEEANDGRIECRIRYGHLALAIAAAVGATLAVKYQLSLGQP